MATLNLRVDSTLRDTHVLKLHGEAFGSSARPPTAIEVFVISALAVRHAIIGPDDEGMQIP